MRILKCLCVLLLFSSIYTLSAQQISTDNSESLEALIQANFGQGCVDISNITSAVNGQSNGFNSYGAFYKADSNFPFENGLVLSTGSISSAGNVLNTNTLNEGSNSWLTDSDLESALNISNTLNATSIEFDFISATNQIGFNYILASEEYNTNFPCQYSDGFAFLIKETGSADPYTNIALIPGTSIPVNTNTIRPEIVGFCPAENETYFEGYNIGDTNFNGRTTVLTAEANITPNIQYHIKLVIADQSDLNYDSAVFIKGTNNTIASVNLGPDINTCGESVLIDGAIQNNLATYQWYLNGALIPDAISATYLATVSGTYRLEINLQINNTACLVEDEINISLNSEQEVGLISDFELCDDPSNDGFEVFDLTTKDNDALNVVPPGNYNISYHLTNSGALTGTGTITVPWQNISNPQTIYVRIEDIDSGCLAFSTFNLIVNNSPIFTEPSDIALCDDDTADGLTVIDLEATTDEISSGFSNLSISYHNTQNDANLNQNEILSPYVNTNISETLFVRIEDITTGCINTTSFNIEVLENPVINQEIQWINACENDEDGFEIFNLTTVINEILQGINGVSVSFYETILDAQTASNPIIDPTNYQNIIPNFQYVYIRVTDDVTGCYSIVPIELHTNIVFSGFNLNDFGLCDDTSNDEVVDFDLTEIELTLLNSYLGFDITFFETESDQENNSNALDKNTPYTVTTINSTIYITVEIDSCPTFTSIELVINPAIEIQDLETVEYCDNDFDGSTSILLETFDDYVSTGIDFPSVRYYLTEDDALNNENVLPDSFTNTTNPITIYTRVTNSQTTCYDIAALQIEVIDPPFVSSPTNIVICDDDQDGIYIVDLVSKIPEIVTDTTDLNITFHTNIDNAIEGTNAILNPENYSTSTDYIYTKVLNTITTCYSIVGFNIYVNTLPEFIPISNFITCEDDGDELNDFFFNLKDEEILNGQSGKQVLYFETAQDAIDRINIIDKNLAYQNLSNPQTIHVRVENLTDPDCFGTSSLVINVTQFPLYNIPTTIDLCDDISNDGIEIFDLTQKITEISNGIPENLDISFHLSLNDADLNLNELPLSYSNTSNPQQLFVRIENGSFCYSITDFEIGVIQVPEVNTPPDLTNCDSDYDGLTTFNLTDVEIDVLDIRQDNLNISYHETLLGTETDTDIISDPENYINISNPQIVYIKISNTISNCYSVLPINLFVNLPPQINEFETFEICINPASSFDLNDIDSVIVDDPTDVIFSYYESFSNAQNNSNPLDTNYTYTTTNDTIFVRVEFATTGCFYIYPFQLIINPLPIANQPTDLQTCDDDSNDGIEEFNLFSVNSTILGTQNANAFTVTYYTSEAEAILGTNPVTYNYIGIDGQTIFARIENNLTGCYNLTQFNLIVNNHPNVPTLITNCDTDYDGITSFDLTSVETELFDTVNPDNVISYFENLENLENDTNAISVPSEYINLTSPQTVYIKVFNTTANCFTSVSLELDVNLPPAIDPLSSFELCANENGTATLSDINSPLLIQTANVFVEYYASETDAMNQTNPLSDAYQYQSSSDVIFARVEFSTTHCYYIHEFNLIVNPTPVAHTPNNLTECDDDFDGFYIFNLTTQNASVLNGQDPNEFTVSYHNDLLAAEEGINSLNQFYEAFNNEIIYVRVENNTTACYDISSFEIVIHPKPIVDIGTQVICLDNLPLIVSANTNQTGDTYLWSTNQTTPEIEITEIGTYSVTVTSPFGCETTEVFAVIESEAADIIITESIDFADPNNIVVTVNGFGNYIYQLDDDEPQLSNVFQNVSLGYHTITIIDLNGCASVTKDIVVIDAPKFMTPNDDGYFDTWHITGVETLPGTIIYIFDRYGKLLKTLTSNSPGWNGFYNGSLMPNSDYWYLAQVRKGTNSFEVKGHFTLRY